jgi:CubicO group peptidase (beta-lactamase class C family)
MRINSNETVLLLIVVLLATMTLETRTRGVNVGAAEASQSSVSHRDALIARAKALELDTPYVPPPGDALHHHASGFAKIMCSAVFITGLEPDFAAENVGYFTSSYPERAKLGKPVIDRTNKAVHITLPSGVRRTARYLGDQGCVTLPIGKDSVSFKPIQVKSRLPDPSTQPWPMGDVIPGAPLPKEIDANKVKQAVDAAFEPAAGMTAAFVVTWKGKIIGERYGEGITLRTPLESWSMGKSLTATLLGILIKQGLYDLWQPAPIPEWQGAADPRAKIRIADILRMSSGLRIRAPQDPDYDPSGPYPDHLYLYTGGVNSFHYAATRPLQWPPGTVGRYRNTDPVLINYLVRLGVEKRGEEYLSFPQRALFDKIGIRTMVMETDPFGNFLTQGYEYASGRDWARLGNLYLQDGVWNGERILPEGFAKFVSTLAPAWEADKRPIYGGFFWINGDGSFPVPREAYYMAGAGGQTTLIIPSHDLVVVRLGHYKGSAIGIESFKRALALLMEAVPQSPSAAAPEPTTSSQQPARSVKGQVLLSKETPRVSLEFDKGFKYVGGHDFILYDVARAEQHFFVDADQQGRIKRFYWVQFEGYLPGNNHSYKYKVNKTVKLGGLEFIADAYARNVKANPGRPDSDGSRARAFLEGKGYRMASDEIISQRLVHLVDEAKRNELMVIYAEDLSTMNLTAADVAPGGRSAERWEEISTALLDRAVKGMKVLP